MAASRIKGITVEIDGDTTKLSTALKGVNSDIRDTQSQLKDVEKLLKLDPGNTELLAQKHRLLGDAVAETKTKLETLKTAAEQANTALANGEISQSQYDALQREIIETEQNLRQLEEQAGRSAVALEKIGATGETLKNVGSKISDVGQSLTTHVTLPLAAVGAAGAKSFAEVDKTMQLANKTMGNTEEQAETLNTAMKNAAANSTYGMSDAANATLNFARAGLNAEQAAAALAPAMNLAAGEGGSLDTVSAGLVATLNSFHASFDEAGTYADVFAAACNNSALDVNSLSEAMSVAAPMFSAAGYSVQDATLAMGLMGNAGIEAGVSANSLKTGLARLAAPAKDGAAALEALGFSTGSAADNEEKLIKAQNKLEEKSAALTAKQLKYNEALAKYGEGSSQAASAQAALVKAQNDVEQAQSAVNILTQEGAAGTSAYGALLGDQEGNMKPFVEVVKSLQGAFSGLSEQEQIAAASAIFGKNQMTPWLALLNTAPEDVDSLSASIGACAGTTQEMADTMMGGFGGGIEKLKSSIDVLVYSIGQSLAPILQKAVDFVQGLVDKFNALSPAQQELIVKIGLVVAAIGSLLLVIGKLVSAVGTVMTWAPKIGVAIPKISVALGGISAPVLAVVAAVAALVAAFVHLWNTNEEFRNAITAIWEGIVSKVQEFCQGIVDRLNALGFDFQNITEVLGAVWDGFCNLLAPVFEGAFAAISAILGTVLDVLTGLLDVFIGIFTGNWSQAWDGVKGIFSGIWDGIVGILSTALNMLKGIADTVLGWFGTNWETVWNSVKSFFEGVWTGIRDFFVGIWDGIKNTVTTVVTAISDFLTNAWNAISNAVTTAFNAVKDTITTIWNAIYTTIEPLLTAFQYLFETIFQAIQILVGRAFETIKETATTIWNAIVSFLTPILEGIKNTFETIWNAISTAVSTALSSIQSTVQTVWNAISSFLKPILDGIKNAVQTAWNAIKTAVTTVMNGIQSVISTVWNAISGTVSNVVNTIKNTVSTVFNNIWNGIKGTMGNIVNSIRDGFNNAIQYITSLPSKALQWGKDIIMGIVNGIKACIGKVADAVTSVADKIRSVLHFSVPDEGPLTDFESWMPDFMKGLANGIEQSRGMIQNAMKNVATDMIINPAAAVQEISVSGDGTSSVSQNGQIPGPLIEVREMIVRSEDDIRKISQQLYRQLQQGRRANGYM